MSLVEPADGANDVVRPSTRQVAAHARGQKSTCGDADESSSFFDETKVPVEVVVVPNWEIDGLAADAFMVIGEKVSHRLAQRPGSYVVLKYVRQVIKRIDTAIISCPPAPQSVIEGSRADVSFIAACWLINLPTISHCIVSISA